MQTNMQKKKIWHRNLQINFFNMQICKICNKICKNNMQENMLKNMQNMQNQVNR
jgi:hypothetical protein